MIKKTSIIIFFIAYFTIGIFTFNDLLNPYDGFNDFYIWFICVNFFGSIFSLIYFMSKYIWNYDHTQVGK